MRHLRESDAGEFALCVDAWCGPDARKIQVSAHNSSGPLAWMVRVRMDRSASFRVQLAACGRLVPPTDFCREVERRNGHQRLAPLPDFCSPDCVDCAVILDRVEEAKVVQFARYTSDAWTPLPRPRDFSADRIARKLATARRRP